MIKLYIPTHHNSEHFLCGTTHIYIPASYISVVMIQLIFILLYNYITIPCSELYTMYVMMYPATVYVCYECISLAYTHVCIHTHHMYIHTHAHTHIHAYTHIHTHTQTHTHIHTCTYTRTHIRTHTYTCTHICAHTHTHTNTHMYIHTHTHTYTHIYIHTYMHICACAHTRTHTQTLISHRIKQLLGYSNSLNDITDVPRTGRTRGAMKCGHTTNDTFPATVIIIQ